MTDPLSPSQRKIANRAIRQAAKMIGGIPRLADYLDIEQTSVYKWLKDRKVPGDHAIRIYALTNISPFALRPDLDDR